MPDEIKSVSWCEQDFSAWSLGQAEALRAARDAIASAGGRRADPPSVLQRLDWDNLAEEIEGLAKKDRRRREAESAVACRSSAAISRACRAVSRQGEVEGTIEERLSCKYTVGQVLGDWLLETPPAPAHRANRRRRSA